MPASFLTVRRARWWVLLAVWGLWLATQAWGRTDVYDPSPAKTLLLNNVSLHKRQALLKRETKEVYSVIDHLLRIGVFTFISAVCAGLTLGVMCTDMFTLEIIAESGPQPDNRCAAKLLPLRRQGHQTLCTLIITNMLCNVLIAQEFTSLFDAVQTLERSRSGVVSAPEPDGGRRLREFVVATTVILVFTELIPMSICKSKHSLRVAAAGSTFVRVAMVLTYPVSKPLGKLLDLLVGGAEAGQIYDRNELRRLMVVHYEREGDSSMVRSELDLLLAAMDFHDRRARDVMTPLERVTYVHDEDVVSLDFVQKLWMAGRSRVPVRSAQGHFHSVLVVKDLMLIHARAESERVTVGHIVRRHHRLFAMVKESATLPTLLRLFQATKTHMALVYAEATNTGEDPGEEAPPGVVPLPECGLLDGAAARSHRVIGLVTMNDVVETLLNDNIYDEHDRCDAAEDHPAAAAAAAAREPGQNIRRPLVGPETLPEPQQPLRVNFYAYFTHPEQHRPLTAAQTWAVAYYLQRSVRSFYFWRPGWITMLLNACGDTPLVRPSSSASTTTAAAASPEETDEEGAPAEVVAAAEGRTARPRPHRGGHTPFLQTAAGESFVLYRRGTPSDTFTLVLGGRVNLVVGPECFHRTLTSFDWVGEEALTSPVYIPDFSAVVRTAARVYRIPRATYEEHLRLHTASQSAGERMAVSAAFHTGLPSVRPSSSLLPLPTREEPGSTRHRSASAVLLDAGTKGRYGTFHTSAL